MSIPDAYAADFAAFPAVLRELVLAELAAGNAIAELSGGYPAAPCGACIRLARPVHPSRRRKTATLDFYARNTSSHAGEFTDAQRHFFVLEPPLPPEPPPDMDAIRARLAASVPAPIAPRPATSRAATPAAPSTAHPGSLLARFEASMHIDYVKWHDGIGYDLSLIPQASPAERQAIEAMLLARDCRDWRDVEALAALGGYSARLALRRALQSDDDAIRMAVLSYAPGLASDDERCACLLRALEQASFGSGLSEALREVETTHPPAVIDALLRGLLAREGDVACHFAAMLYFLHDHASSPFDWSHRPFFLRFNTPDPVARAAAGRELCATLGIAFTRCRAPRG